MKHKLLLLSCVAALGTFVLLNHVCADDSQQTERTAEKQKGKPMKIRIKLESKTLTATLDDNATTRDFVALLPLTLKLQDYNRTEKISDLVFSPGRPPQVQVYGPQSGELGSNHVAAILLRKFLNDGPPL